jgi:hypothetical protein
MDAEEIRSAEFAFAFDRWLTPHLDEGNIRAGDLVLVIWHIITRLRGQMTMEEIAHFISMGMNQVEERLQEGTAFRSPDGEHVNMLLAEERRALDVESFTVPDTVDQLNWDL